MAKGDRIDIVLATPDGTFSTGIAVLTAGRRIKVTTPTKAKVQWVVATEVNRNGKATGDSLEVRRDAVLSMTVHRAEEV